MCLLLNVFYLVLSGLGATMAQGMAFGAGSSIARHAVGGVMGMFGGGSDNGAEAQPQSSAPSSDQMQQQPGTQTSFAPKCDFDQKEFMACLQRSNNATDCDHYYKALQMCQANSV